MTRYKVELFRGEMRLGVASVTAPDLADAADIAWYQWKDLDDVPREMMAIADRMVIEVVAGNERST